METRAPTLLAQSSRFLNTKFRCHCADPGSYCDAWRCIETAGSTRCDAASGSAAGRECPSMSFAMARCSQRSAGASRLPPAHEKARPPERRGGEAPADPVERDRQTRRKLRLRRKPQTQRSETRFDRSSHDRMLPDLEPAGRGIRIPPDIARGTCRVSPGCGFAGRPLPPVPGYVRSARRRKSWCAGRSRSAPDRSTQ